MTEREGRDSRQEDRAPRHQHRDSDQQLPPYTPPRGYVNASRPFWTASRTSCAPFTLRLARWLAFSLIVVAAAYLAVHVAAAILGWKATAITLAGVACGLTIARVHSAARSSR